MFHVLGSYKMKTKLVNKDSINSLYPNNKLDFKIILKVNSRSIFTTDPRVPYLRKMFSDLSWNV